MVCCDVWTHPIDPIYWNELIACVTGWTTDHRNLIINVIPPYPLLVSHESAVWWKFTIICIFTKLTRLYLKIPTRHWSCGKFTILFLQGQNLLNFFVWIEYRAWYISCNTWQCVKENSAVYIFLMVLTLMNTCTTQHVQSNSCHICTYTLL